MNWLLLSYFLTMGLNLTQSAAIQTPDYYALWQAPDNAVVVTMGAELLAIDHVFIAGEVSTEAAYKGLSDKGTFSPFLAEYTFRAGVRFGGFEAGFVDDCTHPILDQTDPRQILLYGGWQGFYISFKGSAKVF